jgi:hypothetical protein
MHDTLSVVAHSHALHWTNGMHHGQAEQGHQLGFKDVKVLSISTACAGNLRTNLRTTYRAHKLTVTSFLQNAMQAETTPWHIADF